MAPAPLLIILKACCFISCECQISAIYIPQLLHGSEWLLIFFTKDEWEWPRGIKNKKRRQKEVRGGGGGGNAGEIEGCCRWRAVLTFSSVSLKLWAAIAEITLNLDAWLDVHLGQICEQNSSIFQSWHRFFKQFSAKWDLVQDVAYYLILLLFWPGCLHWINGQEPGCSSALWALVNVRTYCFVESVVWISSNSGVKSSPSLPLEAAVGKTSSPQAPLAAVSVVTRHRTKPIKFAQLSWNRGCWAFQGVIWRSLYLHQWWKRAESHDAYEL